MLSISYCDALWHTDFYSVHFLVNSLFLNMCVRNGIDIQHRDELDYECGSEYGFERKCAVNVILRFGPCGHVPPSVNKDPECE